MVRFLSGRSIHPSRWTRCDDANLLAWSRLVPLWAPLDNLIYRDAGIVGLRVIEIRPAVVLPRPTPTMIEGRFEDAAARAVRRPLKIELRRKLFIVARRFRAVRSYARAWGLRGLCKLRISG